MNSSISSGSVSAGVSTAWYPKDYSIVTQDLPQPDTPGKRGGSKRRVSWPEAPVSDLRFVPLDCESNQDRRALFYQADDYQRFKRDWERERRYATSETESLGFPFLGILLIIPLLIPCIMIKGILGAFLTQVSVVDHLSTTTTTAAATATATATATTSSPWWHDPFCLLGLWHIMGQQHETDCAFQSPS
eukprot:scaffold13562_cov44-Attheya_sp.AAC.1